MAHTFNHKTKRLILAAAFIFTFATPGAGLGAEPFPGVPPCQALNGWSLGAIQILSWETGAGKSYLIPAIEIPVFNAALNGFDRIVYRSEVEDGKKVFDTDFSTFWHNAFHEHWGFDQDAFSTNQFSHPYAGTIYYGFARSAGLGYWESSVYTFAGSWLWETAGETSPPSVNDQVASGIAGSFFGESLIRMASLVLEGGGGRPGLWRELAAAALSPPTGFNRLVFGERFKPVFPSHDPATFWRLRVGEAINSHGSSAVVPQVAVADFAMSYGLPGKPGYDYGRPFDYFNFELTANGHASNVIENITVRGLLLGDKYEVGKDYRGVWGLYGSYDYISPNVFRVSSTAASLGTTAQWWLTRKTALQGSLLGGAGYGAAGVISGPGERDYHYGVSFQGLFSLRLGFADLALLEAAGREYYISGLGGTTPDGSELIGRWNAGITFRIYGRHALGLQYLSSRRSADYHDRPNRRQSAEAVSLVYTFLGDTRFGAVEWRDSGSH